MSERQSEPANGRRRLLWVSHLIPYPPKSGVHLRAYNLLKSTAQAFDVDLVAFIQRHWVETFFKDFDAGVEGCRKELQSFCKTVTFVEIESVSRPRGKLRTALESLLPGYCYTVRWLQSKSASRAIGELCRRHPPDIAHFDTIGLAPYRKLLPRIPATLGHHNVESHMLLRRAANERNLLKKGYFLQEGLRLRNFERRTAADFSVHITCSDLDSSRLREVIPSVNAITIPNGVDTTFFQPQGTPEKPGSVIFVGSFNWYPNADAAEFLLREIWPLVAIRMPGVRLDLVGSGPTPSIRLLASKLENVHVHGFVDDVRPVMEAASLYVCPIRDGGGTKLKLLDAFSMEKCVIAHPIACEGIAVTAGQDVILADSAADFADRIQSLLNDADARRRVGRAARQLVTEQYSFQSIGESLQEVFRRCIRAN